MSFNLIIIIYYVLCVFKPAFRPSSDAQPPATAGARQKIFVLPLDEVAGDPIL